MQEPTRNSSLGMDDDSFVKVRFVGKKRAKQISETGNPISNNQPQNQIIHRGVKMNQAP